MDGLLKIDICNRLPYGVKALAQLCPIPSIVMGIYPDGKYFLGDSREVVFYPIRPILFPVSCLIEQIQFRGEKIVPIIRLAKIEGCLNEVIEAKCKYDCLYTALGKVDGDELEFVFDSEDKSFTLYDKNNSSPCEVLCSLKLYDWLNSHMIDYRGLIDKGLAKSVFDLKENPYE